MLSKGVGIIDNILSCESSVVILDRVGCNGERVVSVKVREETPLHSEVSGRDQ